jgi:hypothetical protein
MDGGEIKGIQVQNFSRSPPIVVIVMFAAGELCFSLRIQKVRRTPPGIAPAIPPFAGAWLDL